MSTSMLKTMMAAAVMALSAELGQAEPVRDPPTTPADLDAGSHDAQLVQLREELAELRRQVAVALPAAGLPSAPAPHPRRDPQARAAAEEVERRRMAAAESAFQAEAKNAGFEALSVRSVDDALALAEPLLRDRVRGVECRSRSCRVEIGTVDRPPTDGDLIPVLNQLARALPNAIVGRVAGADGLAATVLYLSR